MSCYKKPQPIRPIFPIWSKAYLSDARKPHLISHIRINEPKFLASYEKQNIPPNIKDLIRHTYADIWLQEHNTYLMRREFKRVPSIKVKKVKKI